MTAPAAQPGAAAPFSEPDGLLLARLRAMGLSEISCAELAARIETLNSQWWAAYERYVARGTDPDREEALQLLHQRDAALLERNRRINAAEGCYFQNMGEAARAAIAS